jgi:hypothetical protein
MARKNIVDHLLVENQSLSASFESAPTMVQWMDNISYQINCATIDSEGTFAVEASLDYVPSDPTQGKAAATGNWVSLDIGGIPTISGANDVILIDLNQLPFKAIRLSYNSIVAGTGVCSIYINARQVGG